MYIEDLVLNLINALRENADGIIHMGGSQIISKYDFGLEVSKQLNIDSNFVIPSEYQNSFEKPYRNLDISLNSKTSGDYIRFDTDLESGIGKAILRARDSKYD
jgi:dTDP-4-dehydrorhamnose reductase